MVTKIVNTDIDMYGNRVTNLCVEVLPELPETTSEGRLVYLKAARQIFVYSDGSWQTVGELNPTKISAFENDAGYLTASTVGLDNYYTKEETDEKIGELVRLQFKVVDTRPETGEPNFIYLVPTTSTRAKNVKDEWIWVDGDWELIGSTAFKLNLIQDADGIVINDNALQKATEEQDGLMTKEMVKEFRGKQDKLTAGPNISIENGVISAIGGGTGGGHASFVGSFGGDGQLEYTVRHKLGTYNIIFQMRTAPPVRFVQAAVYADDEDSIRVVFSEPMNDVVHISILACDASAPAPEEPLDIDVKTISGTTTWVHENNTGDPVFCQLYDVNGNEIEGEIIQNSTDGFDPVIATTNSENDSGYMFVAKADIKEYFENTTSHSIDVTSYGYTANDKFLVMVFIDGMGQSIIQAEQIGSIVTIEFGENSPSTGYVILRKATRMFEFTDLAGEPVIAEHNLNRIVGAQLFVDGDLRKTDIDCIDLNTCKAEPVTGSGYLLII